MPTTKVPARRESPRSSAINKATVGATTTKGSPGIGARNKATTAAASAEKRNNKGRRRNKNKRTRRSKKRRRMRDTTIYNKNAVRIAPAILKNVVREEREERAKTRKVPQQKI
jgi:hypothetical protein